jgi:hypothetical protein
VSSFAIRASRSSARRVRRSSSPFSQAMRNWRPIGTKLPPGIELRPVPEEIAARVPQTRDYRYAVTMDRVLVSGDKPDHSGASLRTYR